MNYWIMKSEPETFSWDTLTKEKTTSWDGVRNYQARNNMAKMKVGDLAFFYHSGKERRIMGIIKVIKESYPDHTADTPGWIMVDVAYHQKLKNPITLAQIKETPDLADIPLVRQSRLSISPLTAQQFKKILSLSP